METLSNFEPWKSWKYKQLWGLGPDSSYLCEKSVFQVFVTFVESFGLPLQSMVVLYTYFSKYLNPSNTSR